MSSPRFSVLLPAHNAASTIGAAIDSALNQSFGDFELIVVDDGSTDNTPRILEVVTDTRVRVITQPASGTPAGARNRGLTEVRGDYIAFLDADDVWHANKLERVEAVLSADPEADVVSHAVRLIRAEVEVGARCFSLEPVVSVADQLLYRGNFLAMSATVVRTALVREVGGFVADPDRPIAEDLELWIRLAETGARFELLPDVLADYALGAGISSDHARALENTFAVLDPYYEARASAHELSIRRALVRRYRATLGAARDLARQGRFAPAVRLAMGLPGDLFAVRDAIADSGPEFGLRQQLALEEPLVRTRLRYQLVVRPTLDDVALSMTSSWSASMTVARRWAMTMIVFLPCRRRGPSGCSSRTRSLARWSVRRVPVATCLRVVRAQERCAAALRPEKRTPRSPRRVSSPRGRSRTNVGIRSFESIANLLIAWLEAQSVHEVLADRVVE